MPHPSSLKVPDQTKRTRTASTRVRDPANDAELELPSHREAQTQARRQHVAAESPMAASSSSTPATSASSLKRPSASVADGDNDDGIEVVEGSSSAPAPGPGLSKRLRVASPSTSPEPELENPVISAKDKTRDVNEFFDPPVIISGKKIRYCKFCRKKKVTKAVVNEATTLRRHVESFHKAAYDKWCGLNNFESKLPKVVRERKDAALAADRAKQQSLDPHLIKEQPREKVIPYSDDLFRDAAVQWLVETHQPIQALEHPAFKEMIAVAARSTRGVVVPTGKATRAYIIKLFKKNLTHLRDRINNKKTGLVSLTCDAWQASNQDAYFGVTGHWNEEVSPNNWENQSALFGFTQMNTAHDGVRLGRALFNIIKRIGIERKVGWITCDNASNNMTMLDNFARRLNASSARRGMKHWTVGHYHIRCLAHVINLATQALISGYSKTKFFDPAHPEAHEPASLEHFERDVVGLIRAITVKVRSSAKRKEKFKSLQGEPLASQKVLLLDMVVRWSSTLAMLKRGKDLRPFVNNFVYEMGREETDFNKRAKIDALKLSDDEWTCVENFIDLLKHADKYQQAFSYDNTPSLHAAIPALEKLHKAWDSRSTRRKYAPFSDGLRAGAAKIEEYYNKTATSHAYTFVMLLNPDEKMSYFEKNWDAELQAEVLRSAESIFKERYYELNGNGSTASGIKRQRVDDDSSSDDDEHPAVPSPISMPSEVPWKREFNRYMKGEDELPEGMPLVQYWGINERRLPTWASLGFDYLAIMGSSVSSERAFSGAGITISKRRNRLKADIVEALEFLKCMYVKDLIYREPAPTSVLEDELEVLEDDEDPNWEDDEEMRAWDTYVIDIDSD